MLKMCISDIFSENKLSVIAFSKFFFLPNGNFYILIKCPAYFSVQKKSNTISSSHLQSNATFSLIIETRRSGEDSVEVFLNKISVSQTRSRINNDLPVVKVKNLQYDQIKLAVSRAFLSSRASMITALIFLMREQKNISLA